MSMMWVFVVSVNQTGSESSSAWVSESSRRLRLFESSVVEGEFFMCLRRAREAFSTYSRLAGSKLDWMMLPGPGLTGMESHSRPSGSRQWK